jgi:hypothetical protein
MLRFWAARKARADARTAGFIDEELAAALRSGHHSVFVADPYQPCHQGTKAYVYVDGEAERRDAFFWHTQVHVGALYVVSFSAGYGPHSGRYNVLYIGERHQEPPIVAYFTARQVARYCRHNDRLRRTARDESRCG